jgi:hypothetical protein
MKEHPILFTGEMVRAILEGRKTQTRRPIKTQPPASWQPTVGTVHPTKVDRKGVEFPGEAMFGASDETFGCRAPFAVGDRLWVRETFASFKGSSDPCSPRDALYAVMPDGAQKYRNDGFYSPGLATYSPNAFKEIKWRPSIHMPRWASRLTLEVTAIRPERVQAISEADAIAEGVRHFPDLPRDPKHGPSGGWSMYEPKTDAEGLASAAFAFGNAWNHIYGKGPLAWAHNPWTWAVTFKVVTP